MLIETRIEDIGSGLRAVRLRLDRLGYRFANPENALPGPTGEIDFALARIRKHAGVVPRALELFYRRIGSVNFLGAHPDWRGCDYPDPIYVESAQNTMFALDEFLSNREEHLRTLGGFRLPIAPDFYHKAGVSGGECYAVAIPDDSDDPLLLEEWHHTSFLTYLENALRWGGFPGLERCRDPHTWPLAKLRQP